MCHFNTSEIFSIDNYSWCGTENWFLLPQENDEEMIAEFTDRAGVSNLTIVEELDENEQLEVSV